MNVLKSCISSSNDICNFVRLNGRSYLGTQLAWVMQMESSSIREITGRGRCVIANRRYEPGDLVQCEEPYAMIVTEAYATVACSYCCALCIYGTMYALSSDSPVRYCSEKCIAADYPIHAYESQAIAALEEAQIQGGGKNSMRLVFRVGCCRKSEEALNSLKPNNFTVPVSGR